MAIDYTRRDFNTIKEELLRRASSAIPEWTDRDPADFGMLLVDLWSYMGDVMHYYIDRAAKEAFINTATQRESVLAIANLLDYRPRGRTAARALVTITNASLTQSYTVPSFSVLNGTDGSTSYKCFTTSATTINPGTSATISVTQGERIDESTPDGSLGVSSGLASQRFDLPGTNVVSSSIRVFVKEDGVNNVEYRFVSRISDARFGEKVFSTYTTADGTTQIVFGNNINGFIPPVNSPVSSTFATSDGASGNYGVGTVTSFESALSSDLSITSSTAFAGGSDEESIESLRRSIPLASRPQNRAVTLNDFIDLALGVSGVYKATASYTAASVGTAASVTIYPVGIQSDYTTTTATSASVTSDITTALLSELQPKALLGVDVVVEDSVTLTPINITADVYINERYVASWVITEIYAAFDELFAFDNVVFNQRITLSQIYRTILSIEGVDYAIIDGGDGGVFSTSTSGVEQEIVVGTLALPRKGTITLNSIGGITTGT